MPLSSQWSTPDDFATLFKYLWHQDFPTNNVATGARRIDWTIHIGLIMRRIGDLMGLATRFERGGRKDAVLRSKEGDEIAAEWEWNHVYGNELGKLKAHQSWAPQEFKPKLLRFATLISYTETLDFDRSCQHVDAKWAGASYSLLLILITYDSTKKFRTGRDFQHMHFIVYGETGKRYLGSVPAAPWRLESTRWPTQLAADK